MDLERLENRHQAHVQRAESKRLPGAYGVSCLSSQCLG